jgi:hypothetical protein
MRCTVPSPDQINPETPLRLSIAAALGFPDGSMTASGLRREAARSRLMIERIAGKEVAVEQVVANGFRVCVLDIIMSDWWGITSSANRSTPVRSFKVLGGSRGHVPLHSSAGTTIGQLVGFGQLPLSIIDMADIEPGSLQRLFVEFAPALMRHARGAIYLVVEEAHGLANCWPSSAN